MVKITVENYGGNVVAHPAQSLLNSLLIEGQPIHTVCGGRGRCGCCRVKIIAGEKGLSPVNEIEKIRLSADSITEGWRLACQTHALRNVTLHLPTAEELDSACSKKKSPLPLSC